MAMNETLRETMRQELTESRGGLGIAVGILSFFGLCTLIGLIPGLATFIKAHDWTYFVILILSIAAGKVAGGIREVTVRHEVERMDDNTLKHRHDRMSRQQQRSSIVFYLIAALMVAYFLFRN